ncbi:hypothetical protein PYCCODRAFT_700057 [Trametes coccinea BRFM310]|uniref:Uncharacterized protein n=1 Tax=Trametes coccinea (strain BRFM310) TaxID=1353009 RepID=A0A1Y2IGQ5_TRAC3|nr:hypothetical protein PYCCODRAFT_700057 [Trametes coccinea BRFM310]
MEWRRGRKEDVAKGWDFCCEWSSSASALQLRMPADVIFLFGGSIQGILQSLPRNIHWQYQPTVAKLRWTDRGENSLRPPSHVSTTPRITHPPTPHRPIYYGINRFDYLHDGRSPPRSYYIVCTAVSERIDIDDCADTHEKLQPTSTPYSLVHQRDQVSVHHR